MLNINSLCKQPVSAGVSVKTARLYHWSVFKSRWGSSFFTLMKVLWRWCINKGWQKAMEVMIVCWIRGKGRVEWMVCQIASIFIIVYYLQSLIFKVRVMRTLPPSSPKKNLDAPFWQIYQYLKVCSLPVLYCTTTVVLHYLAP